MNKKSVLDKFYTKQEVAKQLIDTIPGSYDLWLEPSAGAGAFLKHLPTPRLGLDIDPDDDECVQQDFFTYTPDNRKTCVVGNPPFGYQSKLAIDFFNYAASWADCIAFIVPRTFRKHSVQNKLSLDWTLHTNQLIDPASFILLADDGTMRDYSVPCCWQIWMPGKRKKTVLKTTHPSIIWTTPDKAKYAMRRVGGLAGKIYTDNWQQYSTQSHYYFDCSDDTLAKLIALYPKMQETSKDVAGNPSIGKGEIVLLLSEAVQ